MTSSLTLTQIPQADLPVNAPTGKQIMYLRESDGVAYMRNDQGIDASMTSSNEFQNVVFVNSLDDLPDPVAGVIELDPGINTTYWFPSVEVNIGSNVFSITGGSNISIYGMHPQESGITSTSTSALFTIVNSGLDIEKVILDIPSGSYFDINNSSGDFCVMTKVIFLRCQNGGEFNDIASVSFRKCVMLEFSVAGFTFSGACSQLLVNGSSSGSQLGFFGYSNALFDLGTATFDTIQVLGPNRMFMKDGSTFISGASGGANLNASGRGEIKDALFIFESGGSNTGVAVTGITAQDDKWEFAGNSFADSTRNTVTAGDGFMTAAETVTITSSGVYEFINGSNWTSDVQAHFTTSTSGIITYTGLDTMDVEIIATATIEKVGGGSDELCMKIAIDGTVSDKTISCTDNTSPTSVTSIGLFTITNGQEIRLYVANIDGTSNITVSIANIIIKA